MKIAIQGDLHGDFAPLYALDPDTELCLVAGDFGGVFYCNKDEERKLKSLEALPFEIGFVEGNHDCITKLYELPITPWFGSVAHRVASNTVHLPRGEIYHIMGKSLFCFGGGVSADRAYRTEGVDYWRSEMPAPDEYEHGIKNLSAVHNRVDYILTHTAPSECAKKLCGGKLLGPAESPLRNYFQEIQNNIRFQAWFCGHFHQDYFFAKEKVHCLFKQPIYINL